MMLDNETTDRARRSLEAQQKILRYIRQIKEIAISPELNDALEPVEEMLREHLRVFVQTGTGNEPLPPTVVGNRNPEYLGWVGPLTGRMKATLAKHHRLDEIGGLMAKIVLAQRKQREHCRFIYHNISDKSEHAHLFLKISMEQVALMEFFKNARALLMGIAPKEED
ncbi:MAG TPA: hypothetical protein PL033_05285 [Candidatus Brocadiia bacterium]|nr:hypothetical protein [Candidatus Brocadiia bacterium]